MVREHAARSDTQKIRRRAGRVAVLAASGALLVAACGSSATKASTNPAASNNTPSSSASNSNAIVKSAMTKAGNALVDSSGMTLYTLTNGGKAVACTGTCASFWPPLTTTSAKVNAAAGITGIATTKDANGTQVTHDGLPLYRFSKDTAPGDANGEGIKNFGGVWHVVATGAASTGSNSTPSTGSSSGGGGYGY
jgi:predicted lipoprotein with Yx(FWY)xxD motif